MEIILRQPYSFCQPGRRSNQEDARFPDCDMPEDCPAAFVVCDGVGGQDKGEVASRTVADAIGACMRHVNLSRPFGADEFRKVLSHAYDALDRRMKSDTREMATTMTFVCFHDGGAFCAHIGDSRIYHVRPGVGIMYQSEDHSLVNSLVHSGNLTPEEAIDHPQGNLITRCMGYVAKGEQRASATTIQIDDVETGDYFFLCSDGVLHCVDDRLLYEILSSEMSDADKMARIAGLSRNSSDNNTAYLIGVDKVTGNESVGAGPEVLEATLHDDTQERDSATAPLAQDNRTAVEITPEKQGNPIRNFFRHLFN